MLLPLQVVLLKLIIGPTCSIVLEQQPAESNIMKRKLRNINENIANIGTLIKIIIQGLIIFASSFNVYYYNLKVLNNPLLAGIMSLLIIMFSNIFFVQVNSSNYDYVYEVIRKLLKDKVMLGVNIMIALGIILITYSL